jgi:hypothetical protein
MIAGQRIAMGGREWVVPPLNLAAWRKHKPLLDMMMAGDLGEQQATERLEEIADLAYLALRRNYPTLTVEQFEEHADFLAMPQIIALAMGVPESMQAGKTPGVAAAPTGTS